MSAIIHSAAPLRELSYAERVPAASVHKAADEQVLLTDAVRLGSQEFAVAALWTRRHLLHDGPTLGTPDPLLFVETVRQAAIHLSHRWFGVPAGFPFVMFDLDFAIEPEQLPVGGTGPLPIALEVTCVRNPDRPQRFQLALEAVLHVDGRRCGRMGVRWEAMRPERYAAVRRRTAAAAADGPALDEAALVPLPPQALGHRDGRHVLLALAGGTRAGNWQLRADRTHPVLFDHESDHIPGTVLLEAARQAAQLMAADTAGGPDPSLWTLSGGSVAFRSFGELDRPVQITASPELPTDGPAVGIRVLAEQGGRVLLSTVFHGLPTGPDRTTASTATTAVSTTGTAALDTVRTARGE